MTAASSNCDGVAPPPQLPGTGVSKRAPLDTSWITRQRPDRMPRLEWEARCSMAAWVKQYANWTWSLSLTFREDVTDRCAKQAFRSWLLALTDKFGGRHFRFARVMDRQANGRLHFHVLIEVPPPDPHPGEDHVSAARRAFLSPNRPPEPQVGIDLWCGAPRKFMTGVPAANFGDWYAAPNADALMVYLFTKHDGAEVNVACPRTGPCRRLNCKIAKTSLLP